MFFASNSSLLPSLPFMMAILLVCLPPRKRCISSGFKITTASLTRAPCWLSCLISSRLAIGSLSVSAPSWSSVKPTLASKSKVITAGTIVFVWVPKLSNPAASLLPNSILPRFTERVIACPHKLAITPFFLARLIICSITCITTGAPSSLILI